MAKSVCYALVVLVLFLEAFTCGFLASFLIPVGLRFTTTSDSSLILELENFSATLTPREQQLFFPEYIYNFLQPKFLFAIWLTLVSLNFLVLLLFVFGLSARRAWPMILYIVNRLFLNLTCVAGMVVTFIYRNDIPEPFFIQILSFLIPFPSLGIVFMAIVFYYLRKIGAETDDTRRSRSKYSREYHKIKKSLSGNNGKYGRGAIGSPADTLPSTYYFPPDSANGHRYQYDTYQRYE